MVAGSYDLAPFCMDHSLVLGEQLCLASLALALQCPAVAFAIFLMRKITGDVGGHWEGNSDLVKREELWNGLSYTVRTGSSLSFELDGGAWWAAVYGVAQSQTRLRRLSSSSSSSS